MVAAKLKTPLQIGQHLMLAFEAGFEVGAKPVDESVVEAVLSLQIDDLELHLTRNGYDIRNLVEQFDAKPACRLDRNHHAPSAAHLLCVRLTERALCLTDRAPHAHVHLTQCA